MPNLVTKSFGRMIMAGNTGNGSVIQQVAFPEHIINDGTNCSQIEESHDLDSAFKVVHGVVIPTIAVVGIILNILNLTVLNHGKLVESSYTYLTGLAVADLCTLIVFFFNGIGRGFYPKENGWRVFEAYVYFPCGFVTSTAGALLTVTVSVERIIFIYKPLKAKIWCQRSKARKVMVIIWVACIALNIPRFFIYEVDSAVGELRYTTFGNSVAYQYLSWFQLIFVSCSCGLALIILNILLMRGVHKTNHRRQAICSGSGSQQRQDEVRLTRTLISVVFVFLMGEIPSALTSRGLVVGLSGDPCVVKMRSFMIASLVATVLINLQLSLNFVVYCVFNLRFWATFKKQMCPREAEKKEQQGHRVTEVDNNNPSCELSVLHGDHELHSTTTPMVQNGYPAP